MRLDVLLCLIGSVTTCVSTPLQHRGIDSWLSEWRHQRNEDGGRGDSPGKYFHESSFHPHYDDRYATHQLNVTSQNTALKNLMKTYLATFRDLGIETWLMHGSLLGWWWNKQILPWDSDIDVQISESSIYYLAAYYNMTTFYFRTSLVPEGRYYLLEVNPNYKVREQTDRLNVIDARWIDTETGLFIDITTARYNLTHPEGEGMLSCKDGHEYRDTYLVPLQDTVFEGIHVKVPFRYRDFLLAEYELDALTNTDYNNHTFDESKMEWVRKVPDTGLEAMP